MTLSKTWNNTTYSIPQSGERGWASLTNFLSALADGAQSTGKQLIGRRVATTSPVTVTATTDAYVGVNVSGAIAAVNLPAGVAGQVFYITDESGAAATYNITITPNGSETIGGAATYVLNANSQAIGIVYSGSDWKLFANFTPVAVTPTSTTTFSNKKLIDSSVTFVDNGDNTKQFAVECSGITTATTRTWTVPNSDDTFVGKATTDILTNKTLTGNTAVNLISGSGTLTLNTSGTLTLPNATTTLVGKTTTDILTNKTLNGNTATNLISGSGTLTLNTAGTATIASSTGTIPSLAEVDVATATTINAMASGQSVSVFTGSTATTLNGITAGYLGQQITVINYSSANVTITNASVSAASGAQILTPASSSIILPNVSAIGIGVATFVYATCGGTNYWVLINCNVASPMLMGSRSGTAPAAAFLGERISSAISSTGVNAAATTTYGDITSISLTAGVWDLSLVGAVAINGSTLTTCKIGIGTATGNDGSGTVLGDNTFYVTPPTSVFDSFGSISAWRVTISATTTYYAKANIIFSAGTPKVYGRLSATRVG